MRAHVRTIGLGLALLHSSQAFAADYVGVYGNYYKERSTRVMSPMVQISKDLPEDSQIKLTYLVDHITSASIGFVNEDIVFEEFRQEIRLDGNKRFGIFTPSLNIRYSGEPDYRSFGGGIGTSIDIVKDVTTLALNVQLIRDAVPVDPNRDMDAPDLGRRLTTARFAAGVTQVVRKNVIVGGNVEVQVLRGFQENQYRLDQHPRKRDRLAISGWGAYRYEPSNTTIRLDARFYTDTWELDAFTTELRVTQRLLPSLEIEPRIRLHTQNAVFFWPQVPPVDPDNPLPTDDLDPHPSVYRTEDPKLTDFSAQTFGLQLTWRLSFLNGTTLEPFEDMIIQPYYAYMRQTNTYGNAHIAQLGAFWPF